MENPYQKLIQHPDLEVPVPSRRSVIGFLITALICALMALTLFAFTLWMKSA
jgi:hypothetical protein